MATPWLDGRHAIFGEVVEGLDIVQAIGHAERDRSDRPNEPIMLNSVEIIRG